jgi:hypothetical protein
LTIPPRFNIAPRAVGNIGCAPDVGTVGGNDANNNAKSTSAEHYRNKKVGRLVTTIPQHNIKRTVGQVRNVVNSSGFNGKVT